jgi:hypothetical protein
MYTCLIRADTERCFMQRRRLTLTIDAEVYEGLRAIVGPRNISRFIEDLVRPHAVKRDLSSVYREMGADPIREAEALEWAEGTGKDVTNEEG